MSKYYINEEILEVLVTAILNKTNQRIAQRIVQTVNETDTTHTPSAAAVFSAIKNIGHATMKKVVGELPSDPETNVIYLQKDSDEDPTWEMNVWIDGSWVSLGDTTVDLTNYYSHDDVEKLKEDLDLADYWKKTDIEDMKTALGIEEMIPVTEEQITAAVDAAFAATEPTI